MFISKDEISKLVALLKNRDISLLHACHFVDYVSYLKQKNIITKHLAKIKNIPLTKFHTDQIYENLHLDNHISLFFSDYASYFFKTTKGIPNFFGPVLLNIKPEALLNAEKVIVYNRSIADNDFNNEIDSLNNLDRIDKLFKYPANSPFPEKTFLIDELTEKNGKRVFGPEILAVFPDNRLSLKYISLASVDQYIVKFKQLSIMADSLRYQTSFTFPVQRRYCPSSSSIKLLDYIIKNIENIESLDDISNLIPEEFKDWLINIKNMEKDFIHYIKYLKDSTYFPIQNNQFLDFGSKSSEDNDDLNIFDEILSKINLNQAVSIIKNIANTDKKIAEKIINMIQ